MDYAGGDDPESLLAALIAQVEPARVGVIAERGKGVADVVYRGAGGQVIGCEILADGDAVDEDRAAALVAFADAHEVVSLGILTRSRTGSVMVGTEAVPLRPIAREALRAGGGTGTSK